jgi:hypothetical protein
MSHAEMEGHKEQASGAEPLAQVFLGKLPELELELLWRVDPFLN